VITLVSTVVVIDFKTRLVKSKKSRVYLDRRGDTPHTVTKRIANNEVDTVFSSGKLEAVAICHTIVLNPLQTVGFEVNVDALRKVCDQIPVRSSCYRDNVDDHVIVLGFIH
jgi:hypothetical protein